MTPVNPSLQKKTAARMAAVQCLYTLALNDDKRSTAQLLAALKARLANNRDEQKLIVGVPIEPNYKLVESLLDGVAGRREEIDERIERVRKAEWKRERMSPLLLAILQCGIFELLFGKEIKANIVIDEYTRLSRHFFTDAEVDFVHGALHALTPTHG